jgi:hypothetical protein
MPRKARVGLFLLSPRAVVLRNERIELMPLKRSDPRKLAIARLIRSRTSVPNQWIVRQLSLGHVSNVSRYCSATAAKGVVDEKLSEWFTRKR